ncbi:MAG: response regulator [Gemmatimonadetes bacterium]|nr:response regulator [Gemmatimonadota bacterium]
MTAAPDVLVAGLPESTVDWLGRRLPGAKIAAAHESPAAADALAGSSWSLLVLDAGLPGLPAMDLLRHARTLPTAESVPVIYCARGRPDARESQALVSRLAVDHILLHPIDPEELLRCMAAMLGMTPEKEPAPAADSRTQLSAAVTGLWERFRGTVLGRVDAVEDAAIALLEGRLDEELRRHATREAHKLAGSVGTFGFAEGSRIAREIEGMLEGSAPLGQGEALRLSELAVALRAELERPHAQREVPAPAAAEEDDRPLLLVVDDDAELVERLSMEASGRDLRVESVAGIREARRAVARRRPDVVLLSLSSGEGADDGLAFLEQLADGSPPVPAVVLTEQTTFTDRVEVARRGGRGFLQKPVPPARVVDTLQQVLQRSAAGETKILAVDDDPQILAAIRALLEGRGLRVSTLDDPLQFWETLERTAPDLLMLDVDMPHLSGIELCRVVRNDPRWSGLPILFLTARVDAQTVERVFSAGADDYVSKPFVGPELVTRINNRLDRIHLHRTLAETDPLTGVANRRRSEEVISHFLRLASRQQKPLSVAVIDLDLFKQVNDRHGHAVGDEVLQRMAKLLLRAFRAEDVVARWGGEEFVIGMFGMDKGDGVQRLTQVLARTAEEEFEGAEGARFAVTFSAGIAEFPADGADLASLYRAADAALYQAKAGGRNRVCAAGWGEGEDHATESVDVLLVEDDSALAGLLMHALDTRGYRTHWLQDGQAAVDALLGASPALRARVVLLDVDLPGMDGMGVLRTLDREQVLQRTRVVMLTARSNETETLKTLETGAFDHVAKPFSIPVLLQRIRRALEGEPSA